VVAGPHEHVDGLLRGARFCCGRRLLRRAQARQLAAQRRDALSRVLPVQVDQRLAIMGHLPYMLRRHQTQAAHVSECFVCAPAGWTAAGLTICHASFDSTQRDETEHCTLQTAKPAQLHGTQVFVLTMTTALYSCATQL